MQEDGFNGDVERVAHFKDVLVAAHKDAMNDFEAEAS